MSLAFLIEQLLNGLQLGVMLFLMAAGLTLVFGVMGLITIFAAIRLKSASSKGVVMLGILSAIGAPLLGFIVTSLSLCNVGSGGCCLFGFLLGNIGTIPAFVAGMVGGGWALATVRDPEVAEAFEL